MELDDRQLATVIKAVSVRRHNLYTAQERSKPGGEKWLSLNDQLEPLDDVLPLLEAEQRARRQAQVV